jgi:hypothetical protein
MYINNKLERTRRKWPWTIWDAIPIFARKDTNTNKNLLQLSRAPIRDFETGYPENKENIVHYTTTMIIFLISVNIPTAIFGITLSFVLRIHFD